RLKQGIIQSIARLVRWCRSKSKKVDGRRPPQYLGQRVLKTPGAEVVLQRFGVKIGMMRGEVYNALTKLVKLAHWQSEMGEHLESTGDQLRMIDEDGQNRVAAQ